MARACQVTAVRDDSKREKVQGGRQSRSSGSRCEFTRCSGRPRQSRWQRTAGGPLGASASNVSGSVGQRSGARRCDRDNIGNPLSRDKSFPNSSSHEGRGWGGPVRQAGPGTMLVHSWTSGPLGVGWGPIRILKPQTGKETQNGLTSYAKRPNPRFNKNPNHESKTQMRQTA